MIRRVVAVAAAAGLLGLMAGVTAATARAEGGDVDVWVSVGPATGKAGAVVKIRVGWGNHGPKAAGAVTLTYTPPAGATVDGALPSGWSKTAAGTAVWSAKSLAVDGTLGGRSASLPVHIRATATPGSTLKGGSGKIKLGSAQAGTDTHPGNNSAASTISVATAPAPSPSPSAKPSPSPTPRPSPSPSARPTPSRSAVATPAASPSPIRTPGSTPTSTPTPTVPTTGPTTGPTAGPDGTGGPAAVDGEAATGTAAPAPAGGAGFDLDPVAAVAVPFAAVGIGCVLWLRRRLGD